MYKVKLQSFEGPFDLLVYLIESAEMSIYDIQISEITSQYLAVLKAMEDRNIEVTQDFMVLAATLIEIKSKMILPRTTVEGEVVLEEDPRSQLVERLLEYKRVKFASELLREREEQNRHIFRKPQEDISVYLDNPDEYLSLSLDQFAEAFNFFVQKKQKVEQVRKHYTRVERERSTMMSRIALILKKVRANQNAVYSFRDLVPDKTDKYDTVVSFVSVLEMAKERVITVDQKANFGEITISAGEMVNEDAVLEKYNEETSGEEA